MDPKLLKTGACSIVIGHKHYAGYIDYKPNKLSYQSPFGIGYLVINFES